MKTATLFFLGVLLSWSGFANNEIEAYKAEFIQQYVGIAQSEMQRTGIPASIKLAQGCFESGWGRGELATNANNYFGIKFKTEDVGAFYEKKDDDLNDQGKLIKSKFRVYNDSYNSWIDHSEFLITRERYQALFSLSNTDYIGWAKGLVEAGYATDPEYATKLITLIETYGLAKYDQPMPMLAVSKIEQPLAVEVAPISVASAQIGETISTSMNPRSRMSFNFLDFKTRRKKDKLAQLRNNPIAAAQEDAIEAFAAAANNKATMPANTTLEVPVEQPIGELPTPQPAPTVGENPLTPTPNHIKLTKRMRRNIQLPKTF